MGNYLCDKNNNKKPSQSSQPRCQSRIFISDSQMVAQPSNPMSRLRQYSGDFFTPMMGTTVVSSRGGDCSSATVVEDFLETSTSSRRKEGPNSLLSPSCGKEPDPLSSHQSQKGGRAMRVLDVHARGGSETAL